MERTYRGGRPHGAATWGWFVRLTPSDIRLRDRYGNRWPLDQVTILHGGWGFDTEGVVKLPRPAEYNSTGEETIRGDRVLILFLEGSRKRPVVLPGARRIQATALDFLPYNHGSPEGADPNRLAARVQPLDSSGDPIGSVDFEAGYDETAGLRLSVGDPDGGGGTARTSIEVTPGLIEHRQGSGDSSPVTIMGTSSEGFYLDLAAALTAVGALIGGTNPATTMAAKLLDELAAPGAHGYASNVTKTT
jgi:hypothetical protein